MKIFGKAIVRPDQILERRAIGTEGIELLLNYGNLQPENLDTTRDALKLASDNFEVVSLEAGDRLYGRTPTDLLQPQSQDYIKRLLDLRQTALANPGFLVVHLVGGCQVLSPPYERLNPENKKELLTGCLDFIRSVDPDNRVIALENTFPTDWMDEDKGIISFYPMGKLSADFEGRIRTFDIGHSGIMMYSLREARDSIYPESGYFMLHTDFGEVPVYLGQGLVLEPHATEERKAREKLETGDTLTEMVQDEIFGDENILGKPNIVNVHVNNSRGLLDGYTIDEDGDLNMDEIMVVLGLMENIVGREITLVTEVKERQRAGYAGNDYLHAPNQLAMAQYLRRFV